jgi:hypothetical protein
MNAHTSYPIFESGQVLSSSHLNDLVGYLEEQDRLTRNKLIGIGIACGFEVDYDSSGKRIRLSKGCAVTSAGYLIFDEASVLDRYRAYTVPMPHLEETPPEVMEEARYPFFFGANNQQIPLWELLSTDYVPAPGEPPLTAISDAFLADKVLLLFLEANLESLKNCDINDCSDKGAQCNFALRRLLVTRTEAQKMLDREQTIAARPVDRSKHPRYDLKELAIEKIHPHRHGIDNFSELYARIAAIAFGLGPKLSEALKQSYTAYAYLLSDLYPAAQFPDGPFGATDYFDNVMYQMNSNPLMIEYFFDYCYDVAQAYNEFLRVAFRVDGECCPDPERFPKHVLVGEIKSRPTALFPKLPDWSKFDPLTVDTGVGPTQKPAAFRHHFIPSKLLDHQYAGAHEVRSLHYRLYLLAYRYDVDHLLEADVRITPSRGGDYALSDKSVPFYYGFKFADDLHRGWSFARTTANRLDQVLSYQFVDPAAHPVRMEDHNFYRVEGIVGKPLGYVLKELVKQKRQLGLSMGIAPVLLDVGFKDDAAGIVLNSEARQRASRVMQQILACRMGEMNLFFLTTMGMLAAYLFSIVSLLAGLNTTHVVAAPPKGGGTRAQPSGPVRISIDRKKAEGKLKNIRGNPYTKGTLTDEAITNKDPKQSVGQVYSQIKASSNNSNLFDRARDFAKQMAPAAELDAAARKIYLPIALLEQSEDLISTIRAPSIADFDFDEFDAKYEGFSKAFDDYVAEAPGEGDKIDPALSNANQLLFASYGAVSGSAPQLALANLAKDFRDRLGDLFEDLAIKQYAAKNPGMEHRCGVPVGGTLILLYGHKSFLADTLDRKSDALQDNVKQLHSRYTPKSPARAKPDVKNLIAKVRAAAEPRDEFIVLADFCVPYLCCDADCSEIEIKPTKPSRVDPAIVKGSVFGRTLKDNQLSNPTVLNNPTITVKNLDTNTLVEVVVKDAGYAFTGPPGTYRIEATGGKFKGQSRTVTAPSGSNVTEDFVLVSA